jgi:DnaJ-class molecular chaperone
MLNNDSRSTSLVSTAKPVHIKPGYSSSTVLRVEGEGHQNVHGNSSDLLFKIEELPHPSYSRKGDNLIYTHMLTLAEVFECATLNVPTLDGRSLAVAIDSIPKYEMV